MPNAWPSYLTQKPDLLRGIRLGIMGLASLMLILDSVHISQLKQSWATSERVPWPFNELQGSSAANGPEPTEGDLHGYYLQLLVPDLMAIGMMVWLLSFPKCRDAMYHRGLRILFSALLLTLVLWYPCAEILRAQAYVERSVGGGNRGTKSNVNMAMSINDTIAGSTPAGSGESGKKTQGSAPQSVAAVYFCNNHDMEASSEYVSCAIYRARSIFAFVLFTLIFAEFGIGWKKGDPEKGEEA
ncbi:hypothetical protein B0O80DRAFT_493215 [Mortierella sp. GBAus27b]|nr:hypothetical protein BGX31_010099 [Mortierella sp. GBA43]KAI8362201.1 hypothetical protein B0O80DRAFT_493215 [Mortierella sp. GBAus27b]